MMVTPLMCFPVIFSFLAIYKLFVFTYTGGQDDGDFLRQVRMAAFAPNNKDHHGDNDIGDGSDSNTNYRISKCGNTTSSQGGGQQSGNGQGNQGSSSHQDSSGGGSQLSSRGASGQGSSAGGDGNDEEDKEKKMKQAKDGDRQNEVCGLTGDTMVWWL